MAGTSEPEVLPLVEEVESLEAEVESEYLPVELWAIITNFLSDDAVTALSLSMVSRTTAASFSKLSSTLPTEQLAFYCAFHGYRSLMAWLLETFPVNEDAYKRRRLVHQDPEESENFYISLAGYVLQGGHLDLYELITDELLLEFSIDPLFWRILGRSNSLPTLRYFAGAYRGDLSDNDIVHFAEGVFNTGNKRIIKWLVKEAEGDAKIFMFKWALSRLGSHRLLQCALERNNARFPIPEPHNSKLDLVRYCRRRLGFRKGTLLSACESGEVGVLRYFGYNDPEDFDNTTPILIKAVESGSTEMLSVLIAQLKATSIPEGFSIAARLGHLGTLRLLKERNLCGANNGLMMAALESSNEEVWEYCFHELNGRFNAELFAKILIDYRTHFNLRRLRMSWHFLKRNRCPPYDRMNLMGQFIFPDRYFEIKFITEQEKVPVPDDLLRRWLQLANFMVARWLLLEHRRDYIVTEFDIDSLSRRKKDLAKDEFVALVKLFMDCCEPRREL